MAEDGQAGGFGADGEPSVADLMDPVALEARLKEARARRAEALARRELGENRSDVGQRTSLRPAAMLSPKGPAWLGEIAQERAEELRIEPALGVASRVRPVLLSSPGALPDRSSGFVAPQLGTEAVTSAGAPADRQPDSRRRRLPVHTLLFVAGLGLGAAGVSLALWPSPENGSDAASRSATMTATTATSVQGGNAEDAGPALATDTSAPPHLLSPETGLAQADEPAGREGMQRASTADLPPAGSAEAVPALLASPASESVPPPTASPSPALGQVIASVSPPQRDATAAARSLPERITIHYPRSAQGLVSRIEATLESAGIKDVETVPVGFAIAKSNVRFYHASDESGANGVSELLSEALSGAPQTRDFTDYPTPTVAGRVEVWLEGDPGTRVASRAATSKPVTSRPAKVETQGTDPFAAVEPSDQVREVQRILIDRLQGKTP